MNIVGISGRKQSGKNTVANILHGLVLKAKGLVIDFNIDAQGQLIVLTTNAEGKKDWGQFDITRKDAPFVEYAEHHMWPYVKLYSFADTLKWICTDLFAIPHECVWGTDDQKNQLQEHLRWENMPGVLLKPQAAGPMTAREFMQYFGTDVCRKIHPDIWTEHTIKNIRTEEPLIAVISDCRFQNEVDAVQRAGGKVIRLTRGVDNDDHSSEAESELIENYDATIDNKDMTLHETNVEIISLLESWGWLGSVIEATEPTEAQADGPQIVGGIMKIKE